MSFYKKHFLLNVLPVFFVATADVVAQEAVDSAAMLAAHNGVRAAVNVPALTWSAALQTKAEKWALELKQKNNCQMKHSDGGGENLFWASAKKSATSKDASGNWIWQSSTQPIKEADAVNSWASEKQWFTYESNSCSAPAGQSCGHYTQVVWKATTEVGCGKAVCADHTQVWVCNYAPAGNVVGEKPY